MLALLPPAVNTMCDSCHEYGGAKSERHEPQACPIRAALFCSICQVSGHPTMKCPDKAIWHYRKPEFVEHLIPLHILNHYKITTRTPIQSEVKEHLSYIHGEPVIEVPYDEDGKNIRATLASYNLPCSSVKENKKVLEKFGNLIGKPVEYKRTLGSKTKVV